MPGYRNISVSFWTDSKVDDEFTPEDKYFYLYLMTNPHTNICGCYEISMKQMERETGYNTDTVKRLLQRLQDSHGVIRYCSETKEVLIINWNKYNWPNSQKVKSAVLSVAAHLKHEPFRKYITDMVSIRYQYGMHTTDTETETLTVTETLTETITEDSIKARQILAGRELPTVEDVEKYCSENGYTIDARYFFDYYTANGWVLGSGKPMKDWKSVVRTWDKREKEKKAAPKPSNENSSFQLSDFDKLVNQF